MLVPVAREIETRLIANGVHRFLLQLGPDIRIAISPQFLFVRREPQNWVPGRGSKHLGIFHGEGGPAEVRAAQRIGPDASGRRLVNNRHKLFPLIGLTDILAQIVVDHLTTCCVGEPAHQAIVEFGRSPAAALDNARAHLAEHTGQGKYLFLTGPNGGNQDPLRIGMAFVLRHG